MHNEIEPFDEPVMILLFPKGHIQVTFEEWSLFSLIMFVMDVIGLESVVLIFRIVGVKLLIAAGGRFV